MYVALLLAVPWSCHTTCSCSTWYQTLPFQGSQGTSHYLRIRVFDVAEQCFGSMGWIQRAPQGSVKSWLLL